MSSSEQLLLLLMKISKARESLALLIIGLKIIYFLITWMCMNNPCIIFWINRSCLYPKIYIYIYIHIYIYKHMCVCVVCVLCVCVYVLVCSVSQSYLILTTPWTVACQVPLSMRFFRQEYRSGLPFPSPGELPDPGIGSTSLASPALADRFFSTSHLGSHIYIICMCTYS